MQIYTKPFLYQKKKKENDTAASINNSTILLSIIIPTDIGKCQSVDPLMKLEGKNVVQYSVKFLHALNPPGIRLHNFCLKIATSIIILPNLIPQTFFNNTRML